MTIAIGQRDRCVLIAPTFDFIIYIETRPVYRFNPRDWKFTNLQIS